MAVFQNSCEPVKKKAIQIVSVTITCLKKQVMGIARKPKTMGGHISGSSSLSACHPTWYPPAIRFPTTKRLMGVVSTAPALSSLKVNTPPYQTSCSGAC